MPRPAVLYRQKRESVLFYHTFPVLSCIVLFQTRICRYGFNAFSARSGKFPMIAWTPIRAKYPILRKKMLAGTASFDAAVFSFPVWDLSVVYTILLFKLRTCGSACTCAPEVPLLISCHIFSENRQSGYPVLPLPATYFPVSDSPVPGSPAR